VATLTYLGLHRVRRQVCPSVCAAEDVRLTRRWHGGPPVHRNSAALLLACTNPRRPTRKPAEDVQLGQVPDALLNANLVAVSVRQNVVVQKLPGWAAIAVVPTIITGIYGMNFRHMPELGWPIGYPLALVLMIAIVYGLWRHLKRVGWL
jgi:hypothetical protein